MTQSERNLTTWNSSCGLPTTTKGKLHARARECRPVHKQFNKWECESSTRENVFYDLEVFYRGENDSASHGLDLFIQCGCRAGQNGIPCKHALAVETKIESNWSYIYLMFGLDPNENNFADLYDQIEIADQQLKRGEVVQFPVKKVA